VLGYRRVGLLPAYLK